jgi:GH24 family phage-related lysozyme (muramidase)
MYDYGEVEFSALEYLDRLKSDYDRKTKATIDVPMQDKRVMDTVDPQFPMPTTTREPQYVSLEDAPDADIVLDRPTQIETEGLGSRPVMETQTDDGQDLAMPANIDFDFIGQQEGVKSSMYVPKKNGQVLDDSGPTIGIGLDLGQRNVSDLKGLSPELIEKLSPYTGMKGSEADSFVENNPLTLTSDELTEVNAWTKKTETDKLLKRWAEDSDIAWSDLTPQQATVVASVSYQYGASAPKFWSHVTSGDWDAAEAELRDFGDEYKSRRLREARYLAGN